MCLSVPMSHSLWQPQSVSDAASQRRNIRARMSMTPYAIQNSIQELQALRAMDVDYYTLSPPYSSSFLSQSSASSSVLEQNNYVHIDKIIAEVVDRPNTFTLTHGIYQIGKQTKTETYTRHTQRLRSQKQRQWKTRTQRPRLYKCASVILEFACRRYHCRGLYVLR